MALPSFFKIPNHKSFNYTPRYYDERKEKMEKRIADAKVELGIQDKNKAYHSKITRGSMRGYMNRPGEVKKQSNLRLLIILAAIGFIIYLMFFR